MLVHFLLDSRRPHKKGRREASAQEARSQIPEQEDSALGNNTPKAPPASGGGAPSSVCENLYQSHGTQQPAQGFTSGLFHRHGSGRMVARHVTTLVATRDGGKNYITKLSQTRSRKKLQRDCQCLDFCP